MGEKYGIKDKALNVGHDIYNAILHREKPTPLVYIKQSDSDLETIINLGITDYTDLDRVLIESHKKIIKSHTSLDDKKSYYKTVLGILYASLEYGSLDNKELNLCDKVKNKIEIPRKVYDDLEKELRRKYTSKSINTKERSEIFTVYSLLSLFKVI